MNSFEERLTQESTAWVHAGLLTGEQRDAILSRHPVSDKQGAGRFIAILGAIGGALLLAGVVLFISANWQDIGDWLKIAGLAVLLAGAYAAGWWAKISPGNYEKTGDAFFMLGAGLFMAGIALVSQIFHLNARPATGVLVWWLGIVAVPWLVKSQGAQVVSLVAGLTWFGLELTTKGSWLELVPRGHGDGEFFQFVALFTVLGGVIGLSGLALRDTRNDGFAELHEKGGALLVCAGLYVLGFSRHAWSGHSESTPVAIFPVVVVAGLLGVAAWFAWRTRKAEVVMLAGWSVLAWVPIIAVLASVQVQDGGWLWSACAWCSLFLLNVAMVRIGLATGRVVWVNLGIGFIAVNILTRYFDLFGTMLEGGLFFMVSGVIVLGLGIYLERKRRHLLAAMRAQKELL